MLAAWGLIVFRHRVVVLVCSVVFVALAGVALSRGGKLTTGTIRDLEATQAATLAQRALGDRAGPTLIALFRSETLTVSDPAFYAAMGESLAPLDGDAHVASVLSPVEAPTIIGDTLVSSDQHAALAVIVLKGDLTASEKAFHDLSAKIKPGPFRVTYTGDAKFRADLDETLEHDLVLAELVSMPLALFVLLVVFRSVVAAALPVVVGGLSVLSGTACILQLSRVTEMAQYTVNVATLIGLGLAIDYSLFYTSRFREELASGHSVVRATEIAMSTAGHTVLGGGLAATIGLSGLLFFPRCYVAAMGLAGGIVVLFSVLFALTVLPALLAVLGKHVDAGAIGKRKPDDGRIWRTIVPKVMARPLLVLLPTLALVLALGTPFLRLETASAYVAILPRSTEARATYDAILRDFPAQARNRITVVVQFPSEELTEARVRGLYALRERIASIAHVSLVESVFDFDKGLEPEQAQKLIALPASLRPVDVTMALDRTSGHGTHLMFAMTEGSPRTDAARAVVKAIRTSRAVADGTLAVTGLSAVDVDTNLFFAEHTPAAVAFVSTLTYLVLLVLFRSIVLPLKAVIANGLSVTASFGALVWIFQEGHLSSVLRFEPGPVEPTMPVLLFCVVFGLSMDYEVLLLGRMREEWLKHGDNARAVTEGLARSGRLITSAAAIMVSVFAAFSLASVIMVKAMGVGMAIAIALDATIVRTLLVPAAMRLFGDWNWWFPSFRSRGRT